MPTFPTSTNSNTPMITFNPTGDDAITLPVPAGIAFADTAEYGSAALGAFGGAVLGTMNTVSGGLDDIVKAGKKAYGNMAEDGIAGAVSDVLLTGGSAFASKFGVPEGVVKAVGIGMGRAANANTTAEFTGVGIRNFSFSYKLVPYSADEAATITKIVQILRRNLYPEMSGSGLCLKYPPIWKISIQGADGVFPKIYKCYLTSLNTTINDGGNAWHPDQKPIETNISFSFMETRALTKKDIVKD